MKRTYYKFTCRILTLVLAMMVAGLFCIMTCLAEARGTNIAIQEELEKTRMEVADLEYEVSTSDREYLGEFTITYYDACVSCCGNTKGITKSGAKVYEGVTVAVDPKVIPLGTYIYIDGVGYRVAQDTGGAIKGNKIDVYVSSHSKALKCGVGKNIKVWRLTEND